MYPYSDALISLLKGVVYDTNENIWKKIINYENDIKNYFKALKLDLYLDKSEGYAFLKQSELNDDEKELRLIDKKQLSYPVTVLCVILRKILLEADLSGTNTKVIVEKEKIKEVLKIFLPDSYNEVKFYDKIDEYINKVIDYGFLKKLKEPGKYEINRIVKAKISADVLSNIEKELIEYAGNIK
jgi:hypothetical protein